MKLQYLGTAAAEGAPALFCDCEFCRYARRTRGKEVRTRAGAMLDGVIKLDFGPDSYKQELDNDLDYAHVHTLLITHAHEDHLDVDELAMRRPVFAHVPDSDPPLTIYGNARVGEKVSRLIGPRIAFTQVHAFETFMAEGYAVTPLEATHCAAKPDSGHWPVIARGRAVCRSEEAFIYLIEKDGKRLLYAHDTDELTPPDYDFLTGKRCDIVSLDCTNGCLELDYIGHMGARENRRVRQRLLEIGAADDKTVFVANHFSHNGLKPFADMQAALPEFIIAYDGMTVSV